MKIAMLGSGAAGSVFAAYLKKGGADDITLIDLYQQHMDAVAERGLTLKCPDGEFTLTGFKTARSAEAVGIVDILIVMVKSTQTEAAVSGAACCIGPETVVVSLQNGLGNEVALQKFVPSGRILFGSGNMGTELPEPGVCVAKPHEGTNMYFGPCEMNALTERAGRYLETCFRTGGLCPQFCEDVRPFVWKKATSNSGNNTVCAILRLKIKEANDDPYGMALINGI